MRFCAVAFLVALVVSSGASVASSQVAFRPIVMDDYYAYPVEVLKYDSLMHGYRVVDTIVAASDDVRVFSIQDTVWLIGRSGYVQYAHALGPRLLMNRYVVTDGGLVADSLRVAIKYSCKNENRAGACGEIDDIEWSRVIPMYPVTLVLTPTTTMRIDLSSMTIQSIVPFEEP